MEETGNGFRGLEPDFERKCVNAVRLLAVDTVQKANSGHPGIANGSIRVGLRSLDSGNEVQPR